MKFKVAALVGSNQRFARKLSHIPRVHTGMGEIAFQSNRFWLLLKFKHSTLHLCCRYLNSPPFHSQSSLWVCSFPTESPVLFPGVILPTSIFKLLPPFPFALSFSSVFNKALDSWSPQSELQTHSCALVSCSHG